MGRITTPRRVVRVDLDTGVSERTDTVAVEEPLEIRVGGTAVTVTMRTPGNDIELVHGFLAGEGIVHDREDVRLARYCADTEALNVVDVTLSSPGESIPVSAQRSLVMHGGCGLCGKTSIDAVAAARPGSNLQDAEVPMVAAEAIAGLPTRLRERQLVFERTGGVHAAGLFTTEGQALVVREDIGRHNAVDKVVGWALMNGRSCKDLVLTVSSRASFEIVQKAAMAGVPVLACVSAPSSLAIEAADELGVTLVAFTRGRTLSICSHPARVQMPTSA
ncbi:formate dehydrogenase accessory sulfurtransferase FdhD [Leekyejoonella antrihumi]|uniref:Sulfur carrier protein FdhD n=2 Tax=Leekyejoonella antrihumi TaxID=1660198 RepID=A0A563E4T6_9MICO|nr:formate dehydrogenase accessory sulfurtransferase FdhD [Leekyejoonella antrihumi]TWP36884.1 formate dehydrogenase accessory sulfurtransferase FdhD [Leekyejoonella antrihumi]